MTAYCGRISAFWIRLRVDIKVCGEPALDPRVRRDKRNLYEIIHDAALDRFRGVDIEYLSGERLAGERVECHIHRITDRDLADIRFRNIRIHLKVVCRNDGSDASVRALRVCPTFAFCTVTMPPMGETSEALVIFTWMLCTFACAAATCACWAAIAFDVDPASVSASCACACATAAFLRRWFCLMVLIPLEAPFTSVIARPHRSCRYCRRLVEIHSHL